MSPAPFARRLGAALEPVVGQVYFAPECHERYAALGFSPSPRTTRDGVALPDPVAYFASRGSVMGEVSGPVVAAAFAVFNPEVVVPAVEVGWATIDAPTIRRARAEGATAHLRRVLGDVPEGLARADALLARAVAPLRPEGRPLFAGVLGGGVPADPVEAMWWRGDQLREARGDAHTAAWTTAGLDATEIGLLTEPYWGLPLRTYVRTRGWTSDHLDAAEARLVGRGLLADGALTDAGRELRESIEVVTDAQMAPVVDALGDDGEELIALLAPWGAAIRAAHGYPAQGPHDLTAAAAAV